MRQGANNFDFTTIKDWLTRDVTITLPGWAFAVAGVLVLGLILS